MIFWVLFSLFVIESFAFSYYIEIIWNACDNKSPKIVELYKIALKKYKEDPRSLVIYGEALFNRHDIDPDFAHFFKNFAKRNVVYLDNNIHFTQMPIYNEIFSYYITHASDLEAKMESLLMYSMNSLNILQILKIYNVFLQEISDSLSIMLRYCVRFSELQVIIMIQYVAKLSDIAYEVLKIFKKAHVSNVYSDKLGIFNLCYSSKWYSSPDKTFEYTKVLMLKLSLDFGHQMSKKSVLGVDFLDHVWVLNHKYIENGNFPPHVKIVFQKYFRENINVFKKTLRFDDDLDAKNPNDRSILLANLFDSTFFGLPIYFYKDKDFLIGDRIFIALWDLFLRTEQIMSLTSCTYNIRSSKEILSLFLKNMIWLHRALSNYTLISLPYRDFYKAIVFQKVLKISNLWHSREDLRIKLINVVGATRESSFLFDKYSDWLDWVKYSVENVPELLRVFKEF
jgi:hypothetical protein